MEQANPTQNTRPAAPVETIVLTSERMAPKLTPDEADCVARIRSRPRRARPPIPAPPAPSLIVVWCLGLIGVLLLGGALVMALQ